MQKKKINVAILLILFLMLSALVCLYQISH